MTRPRRELLLALLMCAVLFAGVCLATALQPPGVPSPTVAVPSPSSATPPSTLPFVPTATYTATPGSGSCHARGPLPDPACTPGAADPRVTQTNIASTICVSGYTTTVRPPATYTNALKIDQMRAYGETNLTPADVEEDHLIPLELGGDPRAPANLWPEPRRSIASPGAEDKDQVENALHADVCAGRIPLAEAQRRIATDWTTAR